MNRNGNFCKGTRVSKVIAETKDDAHVGQQKKFTGFFSYVCNGKFAVIWVLCCGITCKWVLYPTIDLYLYQLAQIVGKYIIDSFLRAQSRLPQKLYVQVFQLAKTGTLFGLCFSLCFLFACAAINRVNLAFRTIIIEDTHLTLAVIPFKIVANDSLIFFTISNIREKSCQVSVPVHIYNSLSKPSVPFTRLKYKTNSHNLEGK